LRIPCYRYFTMIHIIVTLGLDRVVLLYSLCHILLKNISRSTKSF